MPTLTDIDSASAVDKAAREWLLRLYGEPLDDALRDSFKDWINQSEQHRVALLRAEQLWEDVGLVDAATWDAPDITSHEPPRSANSGYRWWRRTSALLATAACFIALMLAAVDQWSQSPEPQLFTTGVGETLEITLSDGSALTLGADSGLSVIINARERLLTLQRGRVRFSVAHDASRPFDINVGTATVSVLGTEFSIRKGAGSSDVAVLSGHVSVQTNASRQNVELREGQGVAVSAQGDLGDVVIIDPDAALSWLDGRFSYDGTPLVDVVQDINSFRRRKVHVADESLGQLRITASFSVDQAEQFLDGLALSQALRINRQGDVTLLLPAEG
ncbi:MAG: FecR domain-containing protein [Pseudomonadota bacterium]